MKNIVLASLHVRLSDFQHNPSYFLLEELMFEAIDLWSKFRKGKEWPIVTQTVGWRRMKETSKP